MKFLLLGYSGKLGSAFKEYLEKSEHTFYCLNSKNFEASIPETLDYQFENIKPDVVVNCVALNGLAKCLDDPQRAFSINALFPKWLAEKSKKMNFHLVHFSTESVFNDLIKNNFNEDDSPSPRSVYAITKLAGELFVMAASERYHIIRLPTLFGGMLNSNQLFEALIKIGLSNKKIWANPQLVISPAYVHDVPIAVCEEILNKASGIFHLKNSGVISLKDFLIKIFKGLDVKIEFEENRPSHIVDADFKENHVILESVKVKSMRSINLAILDYIVILKASIRNINV